jgi:glycosyltransferase involved in cell wall biosynthesis
MGGSESSLILMAKALRELGHNVIVFNMRDEDLVADSGVEYRSNKNLNEYFSKFRPKLHIAWRHNIKLTNAPTYCWCHDLYMPTAETVQNFDKILALTPFHKNYLMAKQGLRSDKILVTRNGLVIDKLNGALRKPKNPNKLVWMSSLDRGLDRCIPMLDLVREEFPDIELHIYYGIENLYNYGLGSLADHLKSLFATRPWIKYHGFTEQTQMFSEVSDAVVWPHTASFIETFCLTALEMLELGVFPVTRSLGALADTLKEANEKGDAILLDHGCVTPEETAKWAEAVKWALRNKSWEKMRKFDLDHHDWKVVATEWMEFMLPGAVNASA